MQLAWQYSFLVDDDRLGCDLWTQELPPYNLCVVVLCLPLGLHGSPVVALGS